MIKMDCAEVCDLLQAFADDELQPEERRAIAAHLEQCAACARALAELEALRDRIRRAGTHAVPPGLEGRIRALLATRGGSSARHRWQRHAALAASHVIAACLGGLLAYGLLSRIEHQDGIVNDVVSAHVRSLLSGQPIQVASTDPHTVRPWFEGKIPYSPQVKDLAAEGFPLLGARVDYLSQCAVAAMVYGRRLHRITLFVRPLEDARPRLAPETMRHGYNVLAWRDASFAYFAASDLNREELEDFARLMRKAGAD